GPRIGIEQELERPAVRQPLAERGGGVGMGVDQPRYQQPVGGIDALGVAGHARAWRQYSCDRIAVDQQIGMGAVEPAGAQEAPRVDQLLHVLTSTGTMAACSIRRNDATPASMRKPKSSRPTTRTGASPPMWAGGDAPSSVMTAAGAGEQSGHRPG